MSSHLQFWHLATLSPKVCVSENRSTPLAMHFLFGWPPRVNFLGYRIETDPVVRRTDPVVREGAPCICARAGVSLPNYSVRAHVCLRDNPERTSTGGLGSATGILRRILSCPPETSVFLHAYIFELPFFFSFLGLCLCMRYAMCVCVGPGGIVCVCSQHVSILFLGCFFSRALPRC